MKDHNGNDIDFSDKDFGITLDAPLSVGIDPESGALRLSAPQLQMFGATFHVSLSPGASAQLASTLKQIESWLGKPIEDIAKPDSVQ
ncbi:hypothetical protein ACOTFH_21795 [Achromobacter xylosoxidans]|uniref:hypothetical protein n=1 Tax=Achromobacter ruhlandii TaxID=72557 RepID=UPI001466EC17|nr:hypothetical protein [Achromobacter ruhlandii]CAB3720457.1 hypothetical protein LMG1866_03761 [Achromobacter ruhlandii]